MISPTSAPNLLSNDETNAARRRAGRGREKHAMRPSPLESLVRHDFRLDILCCIAQESLTIAQISGRTGKPRTAVAFHLKLLGIGELVSKQGDGPDAVYTATLNSHPTWVAEAVVEHAQID